MLVVKDGAVCGANTYIYAYRYIQWCVTDGVVCGTNRSMETVSSTLQSMKASWRRCWSYMVTAPRLRISTRFSKPTDTSRQVLLYRHTLHL